MKRHEETKKSDEDRDDEAPEGTQVGIVILAVMAGLVVLLFALQMC